MSSIAIIPARGGSQRLPGKNIVDFAGQPIIAYSIQAARDSGLFSAIVVSTDDKTIEDVALGLGALVLRRPPDDGTAGTQQVVADVLAQLPGFEFACCIYPCAPLILPTDLQKAAKVMNDPSVLFAMAVNEEVLADAGAFYMGKSWAFGKTALLDVTTRMVPLPPERCQDINEQADLDAALVKYTAMTGGKP
jgi:CMP-N-acetylneuraminic acid synthetase